MSNVYSRWSMVLEENFRVRNTLSFRQRHHVLTQVSRPFDEVRATTWSWRVGGSFYYLNRLTLKKLLPRRRQSVETIGLGLTGGKITFFQIFGAFGMAVPRPPALGLKYHVWKVLRE